MEFKIGNGTLHLPSLDITIIAIISIYLLLKWSKQLETRRFTIFIYFLISINIAPVFSSSSDEKEFQLWFPLGFIIMFFYLNRSEKYHPSKMKASVLGLCIALYRIVLHYIG